MGKPLALLASLFFMWGFITVINNTLLPHLRSVFELDYTQTTLIEPAWFIFAMGIKGLGPLTEEGSGLLIMAIAGGALVVVQGWLADTVGLQNSFWLPAACELYALWGSKPTQALPPDDMHVPEQA